MKNRKTTLIVDKVESPLFPITREIPQSSLFFSIAFIFYIAELLEACDSSTNNVISIKFADDVQLLAFGDGADDNCRRIGKVHKRCIT